MSKIYFRNSCNWSEIYAVIGNEKIFLNIRDEDQDYPVEFDHSKHQSLYFENELGDKTSIVYPGVLSLGVEYKENRKTEQNLTFLFAKGVEKTGTVDNFVFRDEKNLSYREDLSKKVSVFLPSGYDGVTPHDILYFFDAQNLFCSAGDYTDRGDPYGSWQLDIALTEIHRQFGKNIIVVAIDNSDRYRSQELFMDPAKFGKLAPLAKVLPDDNYLHGKLDSLDDFMKNTVHPFIKEKYCVNEENIGIGGSSMGGIAALYCGLREFGFYKYIISYSPAYGLYEMSAFENWFSGKQFAENSNILPEIHIYCGENDPLERVLIDSSKAMKGTLARFGYPEGNVFETYDADKPHNEESWRLVLGESFTKLLGLN